MKQLSVIQHSMLCLLLTCTLISCDDDNPPAKLAPKPISLSDDAFDALNTQLETQLQLAVDDRLKRLQSNTVAPLLPSKPSLLSTLYKNNHNKPLWIGHGHQPLTKKGQILYQHLTLAHVEEGISAPSLNLLAIETSSKTLLHPEKPQFSLSKGEQGLVLAWLKKQPNARRLSSDTSSLASALLSPKTPLGRLGVLADRHINAIVSLERKRLGLDIKMTQSLINYAHTVRLNNKAWLRHETFPDKLMPAKTNTKSKKISAKLQAKQYAWWKEKTLSPLAKSPPAIFEKQLHQLRPPFEAYRNLLKAHKNYTNIVNSGGWQVMPESLIDIKPGKSHDALPALRARLALEGLYTGSFKGKTLDEPLKQAILLYQQTHQLWEKGHVTREMWRSINVPAHRRLMEIRLALDKWRASPVGADKYYVRVNVADFHAEVWDNQKRLWRQRVVTGSNRRIYDRKARKWTMPQQTALFSDVMKYIVFRPYWNVPESILKTEILPKLEKEPDHLEKNNFEWVEVSPTHKYLRQKPGGDNALGQVKFLFPNEHDIYMHDTPSKAFFERPVRANSHGCVRVKNPMSLAQVLLEREKRWKPKLIAQWLKRDRETWLSLKNPIAVHLEYVVVRADNQGRVHFLTDVYKHNVESLTGHMGEDRGQQVAKSLLSFSKNLTPPGRNQLARK